jgi:hypothetical protein
VARGSGQSASAYRKSKVGLKRPRCGGSILLVRGETSGSAGAQDIRKEGSGGMAKEPAKDNIKTFRAASSQVRWDRE